MCDVAADAAVVTSSTDAILNAFFKSRQESCCPRLRDQTVVPKICEEVLVVGERGCKDRPGV
jgi:hypothetical protein